MNTYENKAVAKSALEQAVRDFIKASNLNGDLEDETQQDIIDAICDGSDRQIILSDEY